MANDEASSIPPDQLALIDAGNGGRGSRATTFLPRTYPIASARPTDMTGSGLIAFSTVSCASAIETIRYMLAVVAFAFIPEMHLQCNQ